MQQRWEALDELRGLATVCLVFFLPVMDFDSTPTWIRHAPGNGLCPADLVLPVFLFVLGIAYRISFEKRRPMQDRRALTVGFLRRYLLFVIFGLAGEAVLYREPRLHWSVFEAIGLAGIVVFPLMFANWKARTFFAFAFLLFWQFWSIRHERMVAAYDLGGPLATLAWGPIILFASAVAEMRKKGATIEFLPTLVIVAMGMLTTGIALSPLFPINKHLVTMPYILVGTGVSAALLAAFIKKESWGMPWWLLSIFGRNPLLMYILAGFEFLLARRIFPPSSGLERTVPLAFAGLLLSASLAWALDRRSIYLRI